MTTQSGSSYIPSVRICFSAAEINGVIACLQSKENTACPAEIRAALHKRTAAGGAKADVNKSPGLVWRRRREGTDPGPGPSFPASPRQTKGTETSLSRQEALRQRREQPEISRALAGLSKRVLLLDHECPQRPEHDHLRPTVVVVL